VLLETKVFDLSTSVAKPAVPTTHSGWVCNDVADLRHLAHDPGQRVDG
jgi:hypothetical protein